MGGCDTVIGKNHQGMLVTLAERRSRYVLADQLQSKHSVGVTVKINSLLRPYKHKCHIDFAHPYHARGRGLNENSNGLLRQYFHKNWN
ncbi:hypothetical protein [Nitrosomonas supralitoralis]|uniref:hypothetical protein n=1 Tax=Nitrosomonas supralitoralis TaxID=2116706 RepID=UPI0011C358A0|nr:hypothetical protein [Nitrosomonas supralitoralis]